MRARGAILVWLNLLVCMLVSIGCTTNSISSVPAADAELDTPSVVEDSGAHDSTIADASEETTAPEDAATDAVLGDAGEDTATMADAETGTIGGRVAVRGVASLNQTGGVPIAYVVGEFEGTVTFGAGEAKETTLTSAGATDVFVATFLSDGKLIGARRAGGPGVDVARGVAALPMSSGTTLAYVAGEFEGNATFGAGETKETTLTSAGASDVFVATFLADTTLVGARRAGGAGKDVARGLSALNVGSGATVAYVVGEFEGSATFGAGETKATTLTSAGASDVFVATFLSDGTLIGARRGGGPGVDVARAVTALNLSSGATVAYVVGEFTDNATFGTGETKATTLTSAGASDVFVATFLSDATLIGARRAGGSGVDVARDVSALNVASGAAIAYVVGEFEGSANFGAGETKATTLTSAGASDVFVATFLSDATLIGARRAGGAGVDVVRDVQALNLASGATIAYVAGEFEGTAGFGTGETKATTLTSAGASDVYVATFLGDATLIGARRAGGAGVDVARGVATLNLSSGATIGYVAGEFEGSATFGAGETKATTLTSAGATDAFVATFLGDATLVGAKRAGGTGAEVVRGVRAQMLSSGVPLAWVVGEFTGSATFGAGETKATTLTASGTPGFVATYLSDGTLVGAKKIAQK